MQVIGEDADGFYIEGMIPLGFPEGLPERGKLGYRYLVGWDGAKRNPSEKNADAPNFGFLAYIASWDSAPLHPSLRRVTGLRRVLLGLVGCVIIPNQLRVSPDLPPNQWDTRLFSPTTGTTNTANLEPVSRIHA